MADLDNFTADELAMIKVAQNYHQRGVDARLLQAIIHYCQTNNIKRLASDLWDDVRTLHN